MKAKLILLLLFCTYFGFSQNREFEVYPNGLIYSENSIHKLKKIVDSLNLKFKVCEFNKTFKSVNQTKANYISLEKSKVINARTDMDNNISFEEFAKKHPKAEISKNLLVIKSSYFDEYEKQNITNVNSIELKEGERFGISKNDDEIKSFFQKNIKGKWLYKYHEKTEYSSERLDAFYFIEDFISKPITSKYSRLIQYADCLIDTTSQVFYDNAKESGVRYYDTIPKKYSKLVEYVEQKLKRPRMNYEDLDFMTIDSAATMVDFKPKRFSKKEKLKIEEDEKKVEIEYEKFHKKMEIWESTRLTRLDSIKVNDPSFIPMLKEAYEEARLTKVSNDEFEEYVGRYISKDAELEMKRNRRVVGGCSMDQSPRIHAFNIALLSAETTKWEIFLRSHLNIMNDRFDRVSDGSYAQKGRETYIKELEVLDINVLDLIIGISLRVENPSANHYYGSIYRIGRALSETKFKPEIETMLLDMIKDDELDDFNRTLMYFLYDNYYHSLKDKSEQNLCQIKLKEAVSKLPDYISSKIEFKNN